MQLFRATPASAMPSKKKRKLEVEDGSPDIPVLRALREELSLPYLPELFYPNEGDDEDPMRGRETRESATSSAPDSWTSVEFREIDGVKRVVGLSLDNRLLKEVPMTHLKLDALESLTRRRTTLRAAHRVWASSRRD